MDALSSNDFLNNENLNHLLELIGQINSNLELNSVLLNIIEAAKEITDSEASSVFLLDSNQKELILKVPSGPIREKIHGQRFPVTNGIAGWVATHAKPQIVNDVSQDERFYGDYDPKNFTTRNILCVPMKNQSDKVIGVLQAINKKDGARYRESEISLFQALAHQAAIAITNARLNEERKTLLSEIHHRVKNNMAIISGMIQLQAFNEKDEELQNKLLKSVGRISSMATVHEHLYESESFSNLNYTKSLEKIISSAIEALAPGKNISKKIEGDDVVLNINQSVPLSLMISEIIFYLVKYCFNQMEDPSVYLHLSENQQTEEMQLKIKSKGPSIKKMISDEENNNSELQLLNVLAQQLGADFDYDYQDSENRFALRFVKSEQGGAGSHFL